VNDEQGLTVSATALKMLSQWRGRVAHVWNSAADGMQQNADGDDTVDDRNVDELSAQVLRDLQQKYGSLDPDAAGGSAAHVRAKQVVEQLDAVYGAPNTSRIGGAAASAVSIEAMRHDVSNGNECAEMAKRLREAVSLPPEIEATRASGTGVGGGDGGGEPALDDSPSPQLNEAQNAVLKTTMQWLKADAAFRFACACVRRSDECYRRDPAHCAAPPQQLLLVCGAAGTGKSTFAHELARRASLGGVNIINAAPTGNAASNLPGGKTLHNVFAINPKAGNKLTTEGRSVDQAKARADGARVIVLDEYSMIDPVRLAQIDKRLREWFDPALVRVC